ncbi:MAG TPA: ATP-dependent DNA ligase [Anaeromyxobacter sp.]|nr:ATP-dependent DNA ligase [Anaeromyxobacter sp.]
MLLADVARTSREVAGTRSRLEKVELLARLLSTLAPAERPTVVAWLAGDLPQGRVGLGLSGLHQALLAASPGGVPSLSVEEVDAALSACAASRGPGSAGARREALRRLLERAGPEERGFLAGLLAGELRQGALEGVILEAVARAGGAAPAEVRRAAMMAGSLPPVAAALLAEGPGALACFRLRLMEPVQPMLAGSARSVGDALAALGEAALEWKLDGARVQVHKDGGEVRVFSRSLRDVTAAVPEVAAVVRAAPARSLVLDGEALAVRPDGTPEPFQVTMRRFGRKLDVDRLAPDLPLTAFFFDLLHQDGSDLLALPNAERHAALRSAIPAAHLVPRRVTGQLAEAEAWFEEALARGQEGLVAKAPGAPYQAGRRGGAWLKVKRARTLDLVVLAAEPGSGRRRGWLSNLHLGAREPERGGFAMLGKTFKGMTDAMLAWQTERLRSLAVSEEGGVVRVRPQLVVEVAFDGIQASSRLESGLALRFARVKRYREDKRPEDADTIATVRALYQGQG